MGKCGGMYWDVLCEIKTICVYLWWTVSEDTRDYWEF